MKFQLPALVLCLASLLPLSCGEDAPPAKEQSPVFTALAEDYPVELLQRLAKEAVRAVKEVQPSELQFVETRFAELDELEQILMDELLPQMALQFEDEDVIEKSAEQMAAAMAKALVAKTVTETGEIVVVRENLFRAATLLDMPSYATEEVLQAVLVHEVVHVLDNHEHPIADFIGGAKDTDGIHAVNAVIEGHAQFVARQASAQMGNTTAFELFTEAIGRAPESGDPMEQYINKIITSGISFAYYKGEQFFVQLAASEPALDFTHVMANMPTESVQVFEPQWYLDPASRPKNTHDFEELFAHLESSLEKQAPGLWSNQVGKLLPSQIEAALSIVPKEDYERSLMNIVECQVLVAKHSEQAGTLVAAGLFTMSSVPEAHRLLELQIQILEAKREQLLKGKVKILDRVVRELTEEESDWFEGTYFWNEFEMGSQTIITSGILGARGDMGLELNFVNHDVELADLVELAEKLLGRVTPVEGE